jgi:hypothetical protein
VWQTPGEYLRPSKGVPRDPSEDAFGACGSVRRQRSPSVFEGVLLEHILYRLRVGLG